MLKTRNSIKQLLASVTVAATMAVVVNAYMDHTNAPCKNTLVHNKAGQIFSTQPSIQADAPTSCTKNNEQISWATWLIRKPDSMQFHYMDLLELINRD